MSRRITQPAALGTASTVLLTVEDVARAIRRHPEVVRRQARDGRLPGEKIGRGWFFRPEWLVAAGYSQFAGAVTSAATAADESARSRAFLEALSQAGMDAVSLLDQDAILSAVGDRLLQAGVGSFFFLTTDDGTGLRIVHRSPVGDGPARAAFAPLGHVLPFSKVPALKLACETRRPQFIGDPAVLLRRTAESLGGPGWERARTISRELQMRTAISAPLCAGTRVIGAMTVVGPALREADILAVAAFANQTAAAIQAARLLKQSREGQEAMVEMLAMAIELRAGTSQRATALGDCAVELARHLHLPPDVCQRVRQAMLLQDVGLVGLPDGVLRKARGLDAEERAVLLTHPSVGAQFLSRFQPLAQLAPIVRAHHERHDGEGYPDGLRADAIPLETRLISVVNAFAQTVEDAAARPPIQMPDVLGRLRDQRGVSLDPVTLDGFIEMALLAAAAHQPWLEQLLRQAAPQAAPQAQPEGPRDMLTAADSRELRIIYRIAQETNAVLDLDTLLKRIVAIVREVMGYYLVSLVLPSGLRPGELRVGAQSGYVADIGGTIIPADQGITGWVFTHGEPLLVPDVSRDARYIQLDPNVRSELAFPLMSRGRTIGVLNAESVQLNAFTPRDLALMVAVGSQLASTLEVAQLHDRLKHEAMHDHLTRVYNRRLLLERLHQAIAHADRHHESLALLFVDVNQLKHVNDTYGHLAGDALLREVAIALTDSVRAEDVVARYGGDEFVVLLASTSSEAAAVVANRVRDGIARHRFMAAGQLITVPGVSLGVATYPQQGRTVEDLLAAADASLYEQKRSLSA
ncbi:MAG TPA: diguanylate cyclase [Candidatus Limnocylindrales bacterium]|nr:diguanylate cyclase [Candidatus Limnocylindrales bacterium]